MTPEQIQKFKVQFPKHASSSDKTIISLVTAIYKHIQAQAAIASSDDECSSATPMRIKSVAAPTEVELMVTAMSQEARENFLRDFMQKVHEVSDSSGCRMDGVSSDPGPRVDGDSLMSDTVASSR